MYLIYQRDVHEDGWSGSHFEHACFRYLLDVYLWQEILHGDAKPTHQGIFLKVIIYIYTLPAELLSDSPGIISDIWVLSRSKVILICVVVKSQM